MDGPGFFISDDISWLSILAALAPIGIIICLIAVVDELFALIRKRQKRRTIASILLINRVANAAEA
jgi:hypothetical protein